MYEQFSKVIVTFPIYDISRFDRELLFGVHTIDISRLELDTCS